jgi:hypothetical protein
VGTAALLLVVAFGYFIQFNPSFNVPRKEKRLNNSKMRMSSNAADAGFKTINDKYEKDTSIVRNTLKKDSGMIDLL